MEMGNTKGKAILLPSLIFSIREKQGRGFLTSPALPKKKKDHAAE